MNNPAVPGSSPALTTSYMDLLLGNPLFKSMATLVNSQLVFLRPLGILNNVVFNLNYLFQLGSEGDGVGKKRGTIKKSRNEGERGGH